MSNRIKHFEDRKIRNSVIKIDGVVISKKDLELICSNIPSDVASYYSKIDANKIDSIRNKIKRKFKFKTYSNHFINELKEDYCLLEKNKLEKELLSLKDELDEI